MNVRVFQLHKRSSYEYRNIQDKVAINQSNNSLAISDGTTQSFNSEIWAEIITKEFVGKPSFDAKVLLETFITSAKKFKERKFEFNANPAKAALEKDKLKKGSTATFIGLQYKNNCVQAISIGDSNVFLVNEQGITAFPFSDLDSLDANNDFINTEKLISDEIEVKSFKVSSFAIKQKNKLILSTDALSRLILKDSKVLKELMALKNFYEFKDLCLKYWEQKVLEEDDITAVIVDFYQVSDTVYNLPAADFSFPKEEENIFTPSTNYNDFENGKNDNNMHQINFIVNQLKEEIKDLKSKIKLHTVLLISIVALLIFNLLIVSIVWIHDTDNSSKLSKQEKKIR